MAGGDGYMDLRRPCENTIQQFVEYYAITRNIKQHITNAIVPIKVDIDTQMILNGYLERDHIVSSLAEIKSRNG